MTARDPSIRRTIHHRISQSFAAICPIEVHRLISGHLVTPCHSQQQPNLMEQIDVLVFNGGCDAAQDDAFRPIFEMSYPFSCK
jgi:hypothetical protein